MNHEQLVALFQEEFERCKVREGETVIVLTGPRSPAGYAPAMLDAIVNLGAQGFEMRMPPISAAKKGGLKDGGFVGLTPVTGQKLALETLKQADFVVDTVFLLHSPEQGEILRSGTRVLLVVEPPEILKRAIPTEDLRRQVEAGGERLKRARTLRVTSAAGTDLRMTLGEFPVIEQYGYTDTPGRWDHWPSAFLYTWPNEGSSQGKVVLNKGDFVWPLNRYLESKVSLGIRDGYIREIEGGEEARVLREAMEQFRDPEAYAVAHIGWGLDPRANFEVLKEQPASIGNEPRSYAGNIQFSTGPNTEVGGKRHTLGHFDIPMLGCTLMLDDDVIVREGKVVATA